MNRRSAIGMGTLAVLANIRPTIAQTPVSYADRMVIDLAGAPNTLDPALATSMRDWSVVHSIYDSIVMLNADGDLVPLAADKFATTDAVTWDVRLRSGLLFHDGSPVTSSAVARSITYVQESLGPAATSFQAISAVEIVDELSARIITSQPAPWLPSQLAVWSVLFPDSATLDSLASAPVGSGPFRVSAYTVGSEIVLERNPDYTWPSPKGAAIANETVFRAVPEGSTRVADLSSGAAHLITSVDQDLVQAVTSGGGTVIETPIFGTAFLRIATDVAPFDDPRVGQALNHALDVELIASTLVNPESHRLGSLYPRPETLGSDPDLSPFSYDPDRARALLAAAGQKDGIDLDLEYAAGERTDVVEAIAAQLAEVGVRANVRSTELAAFNGSWQDPSSGALRFVTWRPVYDPHTLLGLMFASGGPLARSNNASIDALIQQGSIEADPSRRDATYQELAVTMQREPPAVFLWNLVSTYGVGDVASNWLPRADDWVIPTTSDEVTS